VTNDWQKLGDVVAGIVARAEVMSGRPVADQDAALFVLMLREVYGPPVDRERGVPLSGRGSDPVEGGAS